MCWLMNGWVLSERGFGGCEDLQDGLVGGMLPRELSYIFLFLIQFLIALSFVVWHEVGRVTTDGVVETVLSILQRMGGTVALFVVMTYVVIEGWAMLAEKFFKRQRQEINAEWEAWLRRKAEAEAKGEPFNEPNPSERDKVHS